MIKIITYIAILLFTVCNVYSQDVIFSQFYSNKLHLNPAFASVKKYANLSLSYRNQWMSMNNAFSTSNIEFSTPVSKRGALGLQLLYDTEGNNSMATAQFSTIYASKIKINRYSFLNFGLGLSFIQKKISTDKLMFTDMLSDYYSSGGYASRNNNNVGNRTKSLIDFSAGIIGTFRYWHIGASVYHISQPKNNFLENVESTLNRKYTLHAGASIPIKQYSNNKTKYFIKPNILFQKQGSYMSQINYGLFVDRNGLILGMWYRNDLNMNFDAVILQVGMSRQNWSFAYSYDITISKIASITTGSHELSLKIDFGHKDVYPCPSVGNPYL